MRSSQLDACCVLLSCEFTFPLQTEASSLVMPWSNPTLEIQAGHGQSWTTLVSVVLQSPCSPGHGEDCRITHSLHSQQEARVVSSAPAAFSPCLVTLLSSGEDDALFLMERSSLGWGREKSVLIWPGSQDGPRQQ